MKLGITSKLFLAILATSMIVAVAMGAAVRFSFTRGFLGYVNEQELQRLESLIPELAEAYQARGSWEFLRESPRHWFRLLRPHAREEVPGPRHKREELRTGSEGPAESDLIGLNMRLALLDEQRRVVIGNPRIGDEAELRPIVVEGRTVGWLAVLPFRQVTSAAALRFQEQQLMASWVIGALTLLLAAAVAIWLARMFLAPVKRIADATHRLAAGDYTTRVRVGSGDELGRLAEDFNRLAVTLERNEQLRRAFMADISHELRTPLAVVSSSLDNLGQTPLPTEAAPYLERARQGAERLSRLLRAMSEADRLERAIEREEGEWLDLRELVEALLEPYRELAAGRALSLDVEPAVYRLYGSPDLIVQLLDKLIDNAIGFTPAGGWIRLRLRRRGDALELAMANQGPPLPAQMRERLFDSLVSVRAERDQQPHLGLGLYIVRLIAELHRGYARAADLPHGEGVEFTVGLRGMPLPASSR